MKKYILLSLSILTISAQADWVKISEYNNCSAIGYHDQSTCQKYSQETCAKKPEDNCEVFKLTDVFIADTTKPIYYEYGHFTCTNNEENAEYPQCSLTPDFECNQGGEVVYEYEGSELTRFCKKLNGYEQKLSHKIIEVDETLKAQKEQEKASKQAIENALNQAKKLRECGGSVIDVFLVRNAVKNLTVEQVESLTITFSPIQNLLLNGSLVTAKTKILEVEADGTLVTEQDKTALSIAINNCLGL